ncbi:amidase family protein [Caulobacter segnis]
MLARIEAWEPDLAATWALDAEAALNTARASETRWRRGDALGPLDGVPVTIKELIATRGVAKPLGSAASDPVPEPVDAPPAARLREAGAVILAKTTNPDFGMLSSGLSSFQQAVAQSLGLGQDPGRLQRGRRDRRRRPGTAVAPGHRHWRPRSACRAGWCGIYGLKPSNGRIPDRPGPIIGRCAGPMTAPWTTPPWPCQACSPGRTRRDYAEPAAGDDRLGRSRDRS